VAGRPIYGKSDCTPDCQYFNDAHGNISFDITEAKTTMIGQPCMCLELYWASRDGYGDCNHAYGLLLTQTREAGIFNRVGMVTDIPLSWFEGAVETEVTIK
jgi:hypothetical protein